jgi:hypothetical protein
MSFSILILIDVVAILILTFVLYFPRHRRKGMVVAYLTANIGVVAVASVLASSAIQAGLGLGLFGILSIIRLRSDELDHTEVAYYFGALAMGLFAGLGGSFSWAMPVMTAGILAALYVGDHPALYGNYRSQVINLDAAYTDETALVMHLESLLRAKVHNITVRKIDLVNDTTSVDVRYQLSSSPGWNRAEASSEQLGQRR